MNKNNDIISLYNDIDDMVNNVNISHEDIIDDEDNSIIYIDDQEDDQIINNLDNNVKEEIDIIDLDNFEVDKKQEVVTDEIRNNDNIENKKKKSKIPVIIFGILDFVAIVCIFLMYGPISYFRNLWVTSAMATMTHQYLAYTFFEEDQIKKILSNNAVIEIDQETNTGDINFSGEDTGIYSSIYEEQVLKRDPGNDVYKVIDVEGTGYKGHLLVVYDPSRIDLVQAPNLKYGGKQLPTLVKLNDGLAGINASGFNYSEATGYIPTGVVIMDNEIVFGKGAPAASWGGIIGFTNDNVLILTKSTAEEALSMGIRDAVSFGPFLIVNGKAAEFKGNGGYGIAPRTAIGQRKDGIVLLLVIDGRRPGHSLGVDMVELTNILLKYGAYNASNLDGGGSSSMVVDGEVISVAGGMGYSGERYLPNAIIVK